MRFWTLPSKRCYGLADKAFVPLILRVERRVGTNYVSVIVELEQKHGCSCPSMHSFLYMEIILLIAHAEHALIVSDFVLHPTVLVDSAAWHD